MSRATALSSSADSGSDLNI